MKQEVGFLVGLTSKVDKMRINPRQVYDVKEKIIFLGYHGNHLKLKFECSRQKRNEFLGYPNVILVSIATVVTLSMVSF